MSAPTKQRTDKDIAAQVRKPVQYNVNHLVHVIEGIRTLHRQGFSADEVAAHLSFLGFEGLTEERFVQDVVNLL